MKKVILILTSIIIFILASCSNQGGYSFENPSFPDDINFRSSDMVEGITLDGMLDEAFYDDLEALEFSAGNDSTQNMSIKAYFSQTGLLIGVERKDSAIYYDSERVVYHNDSIELYINPTPHRASINQDFVQLRVTATNEVESWIGVQSPDGYPWSFFYVQFDSAVSINGALIDTYEKDVAENRQSEGYTVEVFVPWETLGLDEVPQTIDILPAFVNAYGFGSSDFMWHSYHSAHDDPSSYVTFNHQSPGNIEGNVFGDSTYLNVYGTSGFDLSDDDRITQTGGYDQFTFFKDVYQTKYGVSVTIEDLDILNNDPFPKVGLIAGQEENKILVFLLDPFPTFDNFYGLLVPRIKTDNTWDDWQWNAGISLPNGFNYDDENRITLLRDETYVYVFVNDIFIVKREHGFSGPTQPGLFTMNMAATYTDASVLTNAEVDALIDQTENNQSDTYEGATSGFDFDNDLAHQTGGADQWAYLRNVEGELYGFSVTLSQLSILNNDPFPKTGVIIGKNETNILNFFFDPFVGFSNNESVLAAGRYEYGAWVDWQWQAQMLPTTINYNASNTITVLRNEIYVYILVNNQLVIKTEHGFSGPSQPGLFTMNMVTFFDDLDVFETFDVEDRINQIEENNDGNIFENVTPGFDLTEEETQVTQTGSGDQYAYFKDVYDTHYLATTKVLLGNRLNQDDFPKVGMLAGQSNEGEIAFIFDPRPNKDVNDVLAVNKTGDDWLWPGTLLWLHELDYSEAIEMTVIRIDSVMYFFIEQTLVFQVDNIILTGPSTPGLLTMNHEATYTDYFATTDMNEIETWLLNYEFNSTDHYGWSGFGNFDITQDEIHINPHKYEVAEGSNVIINQEISLNDDFFVEVHVSNVTYAPMEWVFPKISILLFRENNQRDYVSIGANTTTQNRFETNFNAWLNWHDFGTLDWQSGFTVRIERRIVDDESHIQLFVNDILQTYGENQDMLVDTYLGSYQIGLAFDFASGVVTQPIIGVPSV